MELQLDRDILVMNLQNTLGVTAMNDLKRVDMPKKALYSTSEIAEALELTVSTIRMAKMNDQIIPDETMSTSRYTWYTADEVQKFAKSRGFYIVFTIAS